MCFLCVPFTRSCKDPQEIRLAVIPECQSSQNIKSVRYSRSFSIKAFISHGFPSPPKCYHFDLIMQFTGDELLCSARQFPEIAKTWCFRYYSPGFRLNVSDHRGGYF